MSGQGSLFGDEEPAPVKRGVVEGGRAGVEQSLFFALVPPPELAEQLAANAPELQRRHGMSGNPIDSKRLHVTLCDAAEAKGCDMPTAFIETARAMARGIRHAPIEILLDRVWSFPGGEAVALIGDGNAGAISLARQLAGPLKNNGLIGKLSSTPHLTLFYDAHHRLEKTPVEPVSWTANEFVLLISHVGQSRYEELGRWPLTA